MVICLERGADLHMAQLMPLPLTVSCFRKIQIGFSFLVPAHSGSPGKRAVKGPRARARVRACVRACVRVWLPRDPTSYGESRQSRILSIDGRDPADTLVAHSMKTEEDCDTCSMERAHSSGQRRQTWAQVCNYCNELGRYGVDIAALSETRLSGQTQFEEVDVLL